MANDAEALPAHIAMARLQEIYSRTAAFYDEVVAEKQATAKEMAIDLLVRQPGERFLEAGCGTGWALSRILRGTGIVNAYGVDLAPGMLAVARERLSKAGLTSPLILADARALPFRDASFDCLLTSYTLEVLSLADIRAVLVECQRVLSPGGRIVVVNLTEGEGSDAAMTDDWKRRYAIDPENFGGARPLHASSLLEEAGFVNLTRRYSGPDWPSEVVRAETPK
jgi:ubiquinone/menaquinone biosynthesis C-methylase UbiE